MINKNMRIPTELNQVVSEVKQGKTMKCFFSRAIELAADAIRNKQVLPIFGGPLNSRAYIEISKDDFDVITKYIKEKNLNKKIWLMLISLFINQAIEELTNEVQKEAI